MAFPAIDMWRVQCRYIIGSTPEIATNVLHFGVGAGGSASSDADNLATLVSDWNDDVRGERSDQSVLQGLSIYRYNAAGTSPLVFERTVTNSVGTATGQALPFQLAIVNTLRTGTAGRKGRGRFYFPYPTTQQLETPSMPPTIDANTISVLTTAGTALISASIAGNYPWSLYSATDNVLRDITSVEVNTIFDTQRRRTNRL